VSRIQRKLIAVLALLVLAVVAIAGVIAERSLRTRELARIEQSLAERAELVRELRREAQAGSTLEELDALADRAGAAAQARVTLIARDGRVLGDSKVETAAVARLENHADRPEVQQALAGKVGRSTRYSESIHRRMLYLALPASAGMNGEIVRLAVDLAAVDTAAAELRRELLVSGALGLAGALVLSYLISWLFLRPVEELRDVVTDIADGKLERRLGWSDRDELGGIAASINRVAEQLRDRLDRATEEKTQLEAVLRSMIEGVLVLDREGRVVLANPRLQELFGAWGETSGRRPLDLIRNDAIHQALAAAASSARSRSRAPSRGSC
jgi:two-component system phosphate regulon sensor histidine kinase PhoR